MMTPLSYLLTRQSPVTANIAPKEDMGGVPPYPMLGGRALKRGTFLERPSRGGGGVHA